MISARISRAMNLRPSVAPIQVYTKAGDGDELICSDSGAALIVDVDLLVMQCHLG